MHCLLFFLILTRLFDNIIAYISLSLYIYSIAFYLDPCALVNICFAVETYSFCLWLKTLSVFVRCWRPCFIFSPHSFRTTFSVGYIIRQSMLYGIFLYNMNHILDWNPDTYLPDQIAIVVAAQHSRAVVYAYYNLPKIGGVTNLTFLSFAYWFQW